MTSRRLVLSRGAAIVGAASTGLLLPEIVRAQSNKVRVGLMLPYTPLHHVVLRELGGMPMVMTSGNRSDEPIAYDDPDAVERLSGIADVFLSHDRPIHLRCDDSVTRDVACSELPVRRACGDTPSPIRLQIPCGCPTLAL